MLHDVDARTLTPRPNESRGFVHRRVLGAAKGFVTGGFTGAAAGFVTGGRATRATTRALQGGGAVTTTRTGLRFGPFGPRFERETSQSTTVQVGQGVGVGHLQIGGGGGPPRGPVLPTSDGCPKGFHLNKSAYSLKDGRRIAERSLCVKNRRRNNDNGKAALRAARRLVGRKKHQETIDKALRAIAPSKRRSSPKPAARLGPTIVSTAG